MHCEAMRGDFDDGEELTRGDKAEARSRAVANLKTLTRDERRVLHLRYVEGRGRERIVKRMRCSQKKVDTLHRSALEKLRIHFADRGSLAPGAPIPKDYTPDDFNHWHWRKPPNKRRSRVVSHSRL